MEERKIPPPALALTENSSEERRVKLWLGDEVLPQKTGGDRTDCFLIKKSSWRGFFRGG